MRNSGWIYIIIILLTACRQESSNPVFKISGQTMGTTYNITYIDSNKVNYVADIDELLRAVNTSMSTYDKSSIISGFNRYHEPGWFEVDEYFYEVFLLSREVYHTTEGAFNPAIMPLVNAWGFGYKEIPAVDEALIDSLLELVDFQSVEYRKQEMDGNRFKYALKKNKPYLELDFSAIAKGYGVDVIARLFNDKGIAHYMIEIGGEVRAKGKNEKGNVWKIGIDKPNESGTRQIQATVHLHDMAMATSGNYRNFYEKDGKRYVHTINPATGRPEINNTLSATVFSGSCAIADAYATAFMVMGVDSGGYRIASQQKGMEAYFIYSEGEKIKTKMTTGLEGKMVEWEGGL